MEYRELGKTGLKVSRLCFGSLGLGPLQGNLPVAEGARLIRLALQKGVNFIDTAEYYRNYRYIREALAGFTGEVHLASKSYASTGAEMEASLKYALRELGVDRLSLFLLHEQESAHTLKGHRGALEQLVKAKTKGIIQAVGVSTHYVAGVRAAALTPEIDVIHPLINIAGIGIVDGTREEMLEAIAFARQMGKGIYGMKALAGGHLHRQAEKALRWAFDLDLLDSVAVGMKSTAEVEANIALVNKEVRAARLLAEAAGRQKRLLVEEWCQGCGACVARCPSKALVISGGRATVDPTKCVLCGYCGPVCPEFALKII
ncbi:MAG: aldo/keto reductase [Firmicutes bacterium]|nr:aldo/keto reductase [Bacillota bacterium]